VRVRAYACVRECEQACVRACICVNQTVYHFIACQSINLSDLILPLSFSLSPIFSTAQSINLAYHLSSNIEFIHYFPVQQIRPQGRAGGGGEGEYSKQSLSSIVSLARQVERGARPAGPMLFPLKDGGGGPGLWCQSGREKGASWRLSSYLCVCVGEYIS
jgi:hypothetical protein